jgi:hypothetical protein
MMITWFKLLKFGIAAGLLLLSIGAKAMVVPPAAQAAATPSLVNINHDDDGPECKDSDGDGECDTNEPQD